MQRVVGRVGRGSQARRVALGLGGGASGLAVGWALLHAQKPLLLESRQDAAAWSPRPPTAARSSDGNTGRSKTSATQPPPSQTKGHSLLNVEGDADEASAWKQATNRLCAVSDSFTGFDFTSIREKLTNMVMPPWMRVLPGLLRKLQNELSMEPWSLSWEIWEEAHDPEINPEIVWESRVRVSKSLCAEELAFLRVRREHTAKALARYLDLPESDVHPDDVPTIAMCGSGGGLRALVAGTSSYLSAHESGLFDCVTYTAGVSGSCWGQALFYSSIGQVSHERLIDHLKHRIGVHIAYPPAALSLLNEAPTNKYLLSGFIEKLKGVPDADFGLVDVYGLLLAARLMVPKDELRVNDYDLKVSNQRRYIDDGRQPMPIYTAVRHEIPKLETDHSDDSGLADKAKDIKRDWFQWFEWTPYELFCEELDAGIPTWAMGRRFENGRGLWRENGLALPELRVPLMLGIWGSAFCATLSHYYREIRPILKAAGLASVDSMMSEKDADLAKVHPVDPAVIPNFMLGMRDRLPPDCPESIHEAQHLQLMDAGMSNNLPIYPLLRPGRDVDIIVAFDASADVKTDNWIKVADGYVKQRGIKGWPMGAGWPPEDTSTAEVSKDMQVAEVAAADHSTKTADQAVAANDLGPCTIWVGTKREEHDESTSDRPPYCLTADAFDDQYLKSEDAGITVIYFPFLKNKKVDGVDPLVSEYMSTWNSVYTPEEIDQVVKLARANFEEGQEQTKLTIRAVWERKRARRLRADEEERERQRVERGRRSRAASWRNGDVGHGDQFSGL